MQFPQYKEFYCELDNVKEALAANGVAVIRGVMSPEEIAPVVDAQWDAIEELTRDFVVSDNVNASALPINRNDPTTFKSWFKLLPMHSMLVQHYGVSHSYPWLVRGNVSVAQVFARIWGCSPVDLITSFDGVSVHFPPEITERGWYRNNDWLHW
jgi:hypothetical protein